MRVKSVSSSRAQRSDPIQGVDVSKEKKSWKNRKSVQFALLFCLVMIMYFVIEVLPLNMGPRHVPWSQIPSQIQHRLPVVVLIALAASVVLVVKQKNPGGKS